MDNGNLNLEEIIDTVIDNSTSSQELKDFKEGLLNLIPAPEDIVDIDELVENYSIEELREMGFDI